MLSYLGTGMRRYGAEPVHLARRGHWEVQCVLRGEIGMFVPDGEAPTLRRSWLWLSPPRHEHGWVGNGNKAAEVAVFHFPSMPALLTRLVRGRGAAELPLSSEKRSRVRALAEKASSYRDRPAAGMLLCHEHVLLDLSLLIYEALQDTRAEGEREDERRVADAMRWFSERIGDNPAQEEVAAAVGVSPSHLRRLFHEVLGMPPKPALDQLRFQLATGLMADPEVKLITVGAACGFESQAAFSRAFKAKFACAPEVWRGRTMESRN